MLVSRVHWLREKIGRWCVHALEEEVAAEQLQLWRKERLGSRPEQKSDREAVGKFQTMSFAFSCEYITADQRHPSVYAA